MSGQALAIAAVPTNEVAYFPSAHLMSQMSFPLGLRPKPAGTVSLADHLLPWGPAHALLTRPPAHERSSSEACRRLCIVSLEVNGSVDCEVR